MALTREQALQLIQESQQIVKVNLSAEQKQALERLADQLIATFPQQRRSPWTVFEILDHINHFSSDLSPLATLLPTGLTQWLSRRDEWVKVGRDLWFPKQFLPSPIQNRRYAVLPIGVRKNGQGPSFMESVDVNEQDTNKAIGQQVSDEKQSPIPQQMSTRNRWKVTLLTVHLNEGYIPVPPHIRSSYPYGQNSSNIAVLPGIWFVDASKMTIWLDMARHRLYGPDITDQLAFLDAGTILEIFWSDAGFTFSLAGQNTKIFEEEARLIDLTELTNVRSTRLESYRTSLRAILTSTNQGKVFDEMYLELCQRQQHKPSRSTIRATLSSSPEFFFEKTEHKWKLRPNISEETGASTLRKVIAAAQLVSSKDSPQVLDTLSLTDMIVRNRQQLIGLREIYRQKFIK